MSKQKKRVIDNKGYRTWIEIDKSAIKHNIAQFKKIISSNAKLCAVVKSNAYGHGLREFAYEAVSLGAQWLAVDSIVEAMSLRKQGIKSPIIVLGYTLITNFKNASQIDARITISSFHSLDALLGRSFKDSLKIHIKVDTGMHRQGFGINDMSKVIRLLKKLDDSIIIDGLYTHFSSAKNPSFPAITELQLVEFQKWREAFHLAGFKPLCHASATSGTLLFRKAHFDITRVGIGLYGLWPSAEVKASMRARDGITLRPVLTWKAVISEIKKIKAGEGVGYDLTESLPYDGKIAIVPIGYWHGLPRLLSSVGSVIISGKKCKIIGRISMDMLVVDVSSVLRASIGNEVVLIGKNKNVKITADEIAHLTGTINYEIITRLNPKIKRFVV